MADILSVIRTKMLSEATITAIVSTRVYPGHAPEKAEVPHVVFREVSSVEHSHLRGTSGYAETRVQFECYDKSSSAARSLRETIRAKLRVWRATSSGVRITDVQTGARFSTYVDPKDGDNIGKHLFAMDLIFWHSEPELTDE